MFFQDLQSFFVPVLLREFECGDQFGIMLETIGGMQYADPPRQRFCPSEFLAEQIIRHTAIQQCWKQKENGPEAKRDVAGGISKSEKADNQQEEDQNEDADPARLLARGTLQNPDQSKHTADTG